MDIIYLFIRQILLKIYISEKLKEKYDWKDWKNLHLSYISMVKQFVIISYSFSIIKNYTKKFFNFTLKIEHNVYSFKKMYNFQCQFLKKFDLYN